jgi:hypothetical protein
MPFVSLIFLFRLRRVDLSSRMGAYAWNMAHVADEFSDGAAIDVIEINPGYEKVIKSYAR